MSKIIRLTFHKCDDEHCIKVQSKERYALLLYNTIYNEPDECVEEIVDYFTADLVYSSFANPDELVAEAGGRFTKKGLKELREFMHELSKELKAEQPHQVTDEISNSHTNL
jgi:hypothetical protein